MTIPTTCRSRALALPLLLAMTLTAPLTGCQGPNPDQTPGPDQAPAAPPPQPLSPDGPPLVSGIGLYDLDTGIFFKSPTYQSCTSGLSAESCVSWAAPLPAPPPGYRMQVSPVVQLLTMTGGPATVGDPPCNEGLLAISYVSTDQDPRRAELLGGPVPVPPGAARLVVSTCFWGELRARLAPLTGSIAFVPTVP